MTLLFYDRQGPVIAPAQAQSIFTNGMAGWANDALIDPTSLQDLKGTPVLFSTNGHLAFTLLNQPTALEVNWPTTRGYSLLILDNGGDGFSRTTTVNFTYQAALDAKRRLDLSRAQRPEYQPSRTFTAAYNSAISYLQAAGVASAQSVKGVDGYLALDQLAIATDALLAEYGLAYAKAHLATNVPWVGLTLDTRQNYRSNLDLAQRITSPYGWIRIVFDRGTPPSAYVPMAAAAKARGFKILGEPIDSFYDKQYTAQGYYNQVKACVDAFPQIDAWEVGNEVNGSWLNTALIAGEVADAAAYVKAARPTALVALTLYWQIGTDKPQWSTFNWARANLPSSVRQDIDVVLLSTYIEDAPMGLAFDEVMQALHAEFPNQRLGIGELDYWGQGDSMAWWYINATDPTGSARRGVAAQFYPASSGYRYSVGGNFWWYFAEEFPADPQLAAVVQNYAASL